MKPAAAIITLTLTLAAAALPLASTAQAQSPGAIPAPPAAAQGSSAQGTATARKATPAAGAGPATQSPDRQGGTLARSGKAAVAPAAPVDRCADCGTVIAINAGAHDTRPAWMGTLKDGGVAPGGVPGRPRAAGVADASGTIVGRDIDRAQRHNAYEVVVLMEDATRRTVRVDTRPALSVGDRVKVSGRQVYLR